jgi:hypothetical protein
MKKYAFMAMTALACATPSFADPYKVLWWDSTPEYGFQAQDSFRKEFSDSLTAYAGGSVFNSTYVSSETAGTLASHLSSNSYDVIVFDATSQSNKFDAADITAVQSMYAAGKKNLLLDGTLYIRSISYNGTTDYPGANGSSAGLTINEVYALAKRGGGFMIGTDHNCCQVDANQILNGLIGTASFSGNTTPSTDGQWNGTELLTGLVPVAPIDILNHWDSVPSEAIAPTGSFTDFLGGSVTLYSQVDVADDPGGGPRYSYISTSFDVSGGDVDVDDPDVPGAVPEPATWGMMIAGFAIVGSTMRRRRTQLSFS